MKLKTIAALLVVPSIASAQAAGGRLLAMPLRAPMVSVPIALADTSGVKVAETTTDTTGTFYLETSQTGRYLLVFQAGTDWIQLDTVALLDEDTFHQKEYGVDIRALTLEFVAETPAEPRFPIRPEYPAALRNARVEGSVRIEFVVDTLGQVDVQTVRILRESDPLFGAAVRRAVLVTRFTPGRLGGHAVRQRVQLPVTFCLGNSREVETGIAFGTLEDIERLRRRAEVQRQPVRTNPACQRSAP